MGQLRLSCDFFEKKFKKVLDFFECIVYNKYKRIKRMFDDSNIRVKLFYKP